jgi:hypothetical protein
VSNNWLPVESPEYQWIDTGIAGPTPGLMTPAGGPTADASGQVGMLSVACGMVTAEMTRHTTFKFCLAPTGEQCEALARHTGAARFAFNQCLRMVKTALTQHSTDPAAEVPWTGFDLINAFNAW